MHLNIINRRRKEVRETYNVIFCKSKLAKKIRWQEKGGKQELKNVNSAELLKPSCPVLLVFQSLLIPTRDCSRNIHTRSIPPQGD